MSEKIYKPISFYDRNKNPKHQLKTDYVRPPHSVLTFTEKLNEKTGVVTRCSKYCIVDRKKDMSNYKVSDFSIENLQSIGAKLTPTVLYSDTDMKMSHVENSLGNIVTQIEKENQH